MAIEIPARKDLRMSLSYRMRVKEGGLFEKSY
jgi:hypothetical protein